MSGTAAAIGAGASLMAAGAQSITMGNMGKKSRRVAREALRQQNAQFNKTLEYNERQSALNRQFIEDYYNKYDSPEAMIRQYKQAGLNPFSYGGQVGSMSSSMGNNPMADPSAAMKPYDNLNQVAQSYQQQGEQQAAVVQNMMSTIMQNVQALEQVKGIRLENQRKEIENKQLQQGNDIFGTELTDDDISDMSNLPVGFLAEFRKKHGRGMTFGDLMYNAMYREGFRRLYDTGNGYGSNEQQNPLMRALAHYYANHPSVDYYGTGGDSPKFRDTAEKVFGKAFDVAWKELLSDEKRHEYDAWRNEWNKRLQSKGINPDGNDLLNTAVRLIYGNGGQQFVDDLSTVFGDMFGKADQGVKLLRRFYKSNKK